MAAQAAHNEAEIASWKTLQRLGMGGRARMTFILSDSLRVVTEAGVRRRHPDYDQRRVQLAAAKLAMGDRLFKLAFPSEDVQA